MSRNHSIVIKPTVAVIFWLAVAHQSVAQQASGPLVVHPVNPRYLADAQGAPVYLTGSHTWSNLQDEWTNSYNVTFDYEAYLDFLQDHNHNFIRMWRAELPQYMYPGDTEYRFSAPHPWAQVGSAPDDNPNQGPSGGVPGPGFSGMPSNGGPGISPPGGDDSNPTPNTGSPFDLEQFNSAYFDRLRQRCEAAGQRGIYVSIMLFEGHGLQFTSEGWFSHPFNAANNVNGINGDLNGDGVGIETHTLANPALTAVQEAYVRKVIDTVNDLDNVMFEIANESHADSVDWQNHFIDFIHQYEQTLPQQHPVLFSSPFPYKDESIWLSNAQAVSPLAYSAEGSYAEDPPPADGAKVVISDSDHIFGCGSNLPWVWKSFTRGLNVIYMDSYYDESPFCLPPSEDVRLNLGYTRSYAQRMNLVQVEPHSELASTGFCLADVGAAYLIYAPDGGPITADLTAAAGSLNVEWFNPSTGQAIPGQSVDGGASVTLAPPFQGHAVLFIHNGDSNPGIMIGDLNGDGAVGIHDVLQLIQSWGPCPGTGAPCPADLDQNGEVNVNDVMVLIAQWT